MNWEVPYKFQLSFFLLTKTRSSWLPKVSEERNFITSTKLESFDSAYFYQEIDSA